MMTTPIKSYNVLAADFEKGTEEILTFEASDYGEALTMAERADAGLRDRVYGIPAADFDLARAEGIEFNEADGLLL